MEASDAGFSEYESCSLISKLQLLLVIPISSAAAEYFQVNTKTLRCLIDITNG